MPCKSFAAGSSKRVAQSITGLTLLTTLLTAVSTAYPAAGQVPRTAQPNSSGVSSPACPNGCPAQSEEAYTLGAGDRVRIDLSQAPQYSGETEVQIDGSLNLPLVGAVPIEGLTLQQATATVSAAYGRFLRRPNLTISLLSRRPLQVGIAGEVTRPGTYTVSQDGGQYPTLTQLLTNAGGITQIADVRQVQVRRPHRGAPDEVINVDLWQLLQTGNLSYDFTLRDGDTVFIPAGNVNLAEAPLLATTSFSAKSDQPINIAVVGEVFRPGTYTVSGGTARAPEAGVPGQVGTGSLPTVTRAIQLAGGIKPLANIRQVKVRRLTRTGSEQDFEVNLWALLQEGDARQDAILQEGDTIVIPTASELDPATASQLGAASFSPDKILVNVVGEVTKPGQLQVPPNTPLNQAILAAGGFNNRARQSSVELLRLKPDGTVSRERIRIDLDKGIDAANNPALQNNDVVIVRRSGLASFSDTVGSVLGPLQGVFSLFTLPFNFLRILP
jgi:polysaccharide export outer membrane protein